MIACYPSSAEERQETTGCAFAPFRVRSEGAGNKRYGHAGARRSFIQDRLGLSDFVHGIKAGPSILNDIKGQCLHLILDRIWETVRDINTGIEVCKP
ncbi:MAG: hypothetical protein CME21_11410 [Gemmatimonadetes bacterium]|nr:hypothetical protein [Gemmatimonadota bacterium]HCK10325.1 hypothetical protein [Candidatus Latescibacterota bacterium]